MAAPTPIPEPIYNSKCVIRKFIAKSFTTVYDRDRIALIEQGRPQPHLEIEDSDTVDGKKVKFEPSFYQTFSWLTGSSESNSLFCWPCLLFGQDRISYWTKIGFTKMANLTKSCIAHQENFSHIKAFLQYHNFANKHVKGGKREMARTVAPNPTVLRNRKFLQGVINSIHYLVETKGLRESTTLDFVSVNNFLSSLRLECRVNDAVAGHLVTLEREDGRIDVVQFVYDAVESLCHALRKSLKLELSEVPMVCLLLEEPADTPSMICVGVRYYHTTRGLLERFVGFVDKSACDLVSVIKDYLEEIGVVGKVVAQVWGMTTLPGEDVVKIVEKIKANITKGLFLPYDLTELISVLSKAACANPVMNQYFASLNCITNIFDETEKMVQLMDSVADELKFLPSSWDFSRNPSCIIHCHRLVIINWFQELCLAEDGLIEPQLLGRINLALQCLKDPMFTFLLSFFEKLFSPVHKLIVNIVEAPLSSSRLELAKTTAREIEDLYSIFERGSIPAGILKDLEKVIAIVSKAILYRLSELDHLNFLNLLEKDNFSMFTRQLPDELFYKLQRFFGEYCDLTRLKVELRVLYSMEELNNLKTPALLRHLSTDPAAREACPQLRTFLELVTILPNSWAIVENGRLSDRIKSHTHQIPGQARTSELALLECDFDLFSKVKDSPDFFETFVNDFSNRQRDLILNVGC